MTGLKTEQQKISIIDLTAHYNSIKSEIDVAIAEVLKSGHYVMGPNVQSLEKELANYLSVQNVISCANGTDALVLALKALDIGSDDEVITVSHSFFATSEAIALVGAKPVFIDIQEEDFNIDTKQIEKAITKKTKAIIPVHLYGQPCEIEKVVEIGKKYNLKVIEDCAQAIGAKYNGRYVGTFGDIGTVSFFPTKNLGAFGDAGAIITNNDEIAKKLRALRVHGSSQRYVHDLIGLNSRLDEIQAAILRVELKYLDEWNKKRLRAANYYTEKLKEIRGVVLPNIKSNVSHVFHQYTIKIPKRDLICEKLRESNIETIIYYPIPIHMQKAFSYLSCGEGFLPVTEKICKQILSIPIYPEITKETQDHVINSLQELTEKL